MKKATFALLAGMLFVLTYCTSSKKTATKKTNITYMANIQPIVSVSCSPCHIPPKGKAKALDTYSSASANIDNIITRIQKNPGDKGFMPMRHPKLSSDSINLFVQWKADGLLEK